MQVELCEIPLAGAPEVTRSEAYIGRTPQRRETRETQKMGVFQQPVILLNRYRAVHATEARVDSIVS